VQQVLDEGIFFSVQSEEETQVLPLRQAQAKQAD